MRRLRPPGVQDPFSCAWERWACLVAFPDTWHDILALPLRTVVDPSGRVFTAGLLEDALQHVVFQQNRRALVDEIHLDDEAVPRNLSNENATQPCQRSFANLHSRPRGESQLRSDRHPRLD